MAPESHTEHHDLKYKQLLSFTIIPRFLLFYGAVAYRGNGLQFPERFAVELLAHAPYIFGGSGSVMRNVGPRHFINGTAVQRGPLTEHEMGQSLFHTDAPRESGNIMEHKH